MYWFIGDSHDDVADVANLLRCYTVEAIVRLAVPNDSKDRSASIFRVKKPG
jgi:hypothetical protein